MSTLPVHNPSVPYLGKIPGGLAHGAMIRIRGHIAQVLTNFIQINVQTGPALGPSDDINLHLSIRPDQGIIVRNHMKNREWGAEERNGGCPIARGQFVEMLILGQANCFKVAINGKHFCEFNHRLPLTSANFIYVAGEMTIESITIGGDVPPSAPPMPTPYPVQSIPSDVYHTPSYQPMHQQMMSPPYTPMHHQHISGYQPPISGYQPPAYPSLQSPNMPPYQSATVTTTAYPSYPSYPSPGGTFNTPYQSTAYGHQPPIIQHHSMAQSHYPSIQQQPNKSKNTALKYAAGIGGIGLGAYVLSQAFQSDSDSD